MKPLTILVAEDDLLARMVLERSVVQWGYQMISAVDGGQALEVLRTHDVDVCIMDWDMPIMTGPEICRWLRTNLSTVPYTVLITSRDHPEEIQAGYEAGADDYLTKPCDMKYLRRRIATVAEKRYRQEQWLEQARRDAAEERSAGNFNPLDIYLSDLRLLRRKS
jgi:sigma-B regulation protein RsbU (phosphoserine phosphatase)